MRMSRWLMGVVCAMLCIVSGTRAQAEKVRIGYLHTLAADGHLWIAMEKGYFQQQGLEVEAIQFTSGVPLMQALIGGSLDVAIMGAVISNFPPRGMGKVFLINDIEYDTAMIFARPETGAKSIRDLRGKTILTVKGTTAHAFLHMALAANGMSSARDVSVVSMDMAGAVTAFTSGAAPYLATWTPFNITVQHRSPSAILLGSAKDLYPQAAILGGWVASNRFYASNRATLVKLAKAWVEANAFLVDHTAEALRLIRARAYRNVSMADLTASWNAEKAESTAQWVALYQDGTVARWLGQTERVFMEIGSMPNYAEPGTFFDPSIFLSAAAIGAR